MERSFWGGFDPGANGRGAPGKPQIVLVQPADMISLRDLDAEIGFGVPHQKVATFDGAQMETIRIASRNIEGRRRGAAVEDQDLDALRRLACKRAKRGVNPLLAAVSPLPDSA